MYKYIYIYIHIYIYLYSEIAVRFVLSMTTVVYLLLKTNCKTMNDRMNSSCSPLTRTSIQYLFASVLCDETWRTEAIQPRLCVAGHFWKPQGISGDCKKDKHMWRGQNKKKIKSQTSCIHWSPCSHCVIGVKQCMRDLKLWSPTYCSSHIIGNAISIWTAEVDVRRWVWYVFY